MSHNCRRLCGSRPVVGSSRNRIFGLATSAVATARRCFWPPDSLPTQVSAFSCSDKLFQHGFDRHSDAGRSWRTACRFRAPSAFPRAASPAARCPCHSRSSRSCVCQVCRGSRTSPGSGRQQSFENFDGRGLAGAVRTQQAETLAGLDGQVETAHGFDFAVVGLAQTAALDGNLHDKSYWRNRERVRHAVAIVSVKHPGRSVSRSSGFKSCSMVGINSDTVG